MALCIWILCSIVVAISLLLLSVFEGKRDELRENLVYPDGSFTAALTDALSAPQERLKSLDHKLTNKSNKLEISQEKIEETKRTISELEITSEKVQKRYHELLKELKVQLAKTESECQQLHDQIEHITTKRDKLKQELDEKQARVPSEMGISDSGLYFTDADLLRRKSQSRSCTIRNDLPTVHLPRNLFHSQDKMFIKRITIEDRKQYPVASESSPHDYQDS